MTELRLLWELQELEQEKNKKEYDLQNMASLLQYREKVKEVKELESKLQLNEEEISAGKKAQRLIELDVAKIAEETDELNHKLYGGKIGNIKELENMEKKVHYLDNERKLREDEIIRYMENIDELESEAARLHQSLQEEQELLQKRRIIAQRERKSVQNELKGLTEQIDGLAAKTEAGLLKKYRQWSKRLGGGRCISLVQDGFCGICNVSLPSSFSQRLQSSGELVYCENCSSLLVLDS